MRQIIALEYKRGTGLGDKNLQYAFWFAIPEQRRVPIPNFTSAITKSPFQPTPAELADLQSGAVIEEVDTVQIPNGASQTQVRNALISRYNARAAEIAALPSIYQYYGTSFDGTAWS